MKGSKDLLLEYLASIRDPERAASLFAENGAFAPDDIHVLIGASAATADG